MTIDSAAIIILLLIAAALLGWLLARWNRGSKRDSRFKFVSAEYFKGLNFLLNEQPDKALEVFIRVAEVDSDTVETHFALGSLFRRRGEVDRAIRIHQNLIARPNLTRTHRAQALFELAQDYLRAGLLDRAESILLELLDMPNYSDQALHSLISLYEQQKDWQQAVTMRRRLQAYTGVSEEETIAQYFCELAQAALTDADVALARRFLKRAQSHDSNCVRANLLLAQMAESVQDWGHSQRNYQHVLEHEIRYATEVLPALARVTRKINGQASLDSALEKLRRDNPKASGYLAIAAIMDPELDDPVSRACVVEYLRTEPSLRGLYDMFVSLAQRHGATEVTDLEPLQIAVRNLLKNGARYRCEECGFRSKTLYWQCPSCKTWNRTMPFHEITFSAAGLPNPAARI
ncbi:MAG: lipopolysaccharide assembly protein LapB [Gammaproteobacteria bacterium]